MQVDATAVDAPVGDPSNRYGNAFFAKKTRYETVQEGVADYNGDTSRSWDMCNENVLNPFSGKPVAYKLVSREVPKLLPKEGSLVWKRAGFARHAVHVTRCEFYFIAPISPVIIGQAFPIWRLENGTQIAFALALEHHHGRVY